MSREVQPGMIDRGHSKLSPVRQCALLGLNGSSLCYHPKRVDGYNLELMSLIDRQYLKTPCYGSRRMTERKQLRLSTSRRGSAYGTQICYHSHGLIPTRW